VVWEHHLALTILAGWFVAQTKVEWATQHASDAMLAPALGVHSLSSTIRRFEKAGSRALRYAS